MADALIVNPTEVALTGLDTKAALDTDATQGLNAALVFTSKLPGVHGNLIKVAQTVPVDDDLAHPLVITVVDGGEGNDVVITIQLAVSADGSTITSTGDLIKAAVVADAAANALVSVADKAANDGSGLASVFAAAALTGGAKDDVPAESSMILDITGTQMATLVASGALIGKAASSYEERRQAARTLKYQRVLND